MTLVTGTPDHELNVLRPLLSTTVAWIAGTGPVTAAHLDAAPQLRLVARYGVGVDAVSVRRIQEALVRGGDRFTRRCGVRGAEA